MTVVIGFKAKKEAVLLSDSRATSSNSVEDKLQKILPIKENIALGYAGNVAFANYVATTLRQNLNSTTTSDLKTILQSLQVIALSLYEQYPEPTDFMLGLVVSNGDALLYTFRHPYYDPKEVDGFELIGSGSVIKESLINAFKSENTDVDIKHIADKIFTFSSAELAKQLKDDSVGGLFQIILLEKTGIRPIKYGYIDIDPDLEPESKSIEMQKGAWTQYDHTKNLKMDILKPNILLSEYPMESRFHDYKNSSQKKTPKWHLLHFITCLNLKKDIGLTEFNGTLTAIAKVGYPIDIELVIALEYWGSAGKHALEFTLIQNSTSKLIYTETIESEIIPQTELVQRVKLHIDTPGSAILQCTINGTILGRRALFFYLLKPEDINKPNIGNLVLEAMAQQNDEEMEKNKNAEIVFFAMCQDVECDSLNLKLTQQAVSFYWEKYPLPLKQKVISSFRLPKGEHIIKLELVDASTRMKWLVGNKKMVSESSFIANPILGEFIIQIPKPGLYFLNAIVDDKRITSILFAAETSEACYSYTLLDNDKESVRNGELLCLSKEATKDNNNKRHATILPG